MKSISIKLTVRLARRLQLESNGSGRSKSEIVRAALEQFFKTKRSSFYELGPHLAGCGRGPGDLSTNRKHFDDFGK